MNFDQIGNGMRIKLAEVGHRKTNILAKQTRHAGFDRGKVHIRKGLAYRTPKNF